MYKSNERRIITVVILGIALLSLSDLIVDQMEGATNMMLLYDVCNFSIIAGLLIYIWVHQPIAAKHERQKLIVENYEQKADLTELSKLAKKHVEGLAHYIDAQFSQWGLTPAEKEVALLVLKGFSMKEIADLRNVTERTARQQSTTIYAKADLPGRAALSAYFLEDLLLPETLR